nr:hypothetical protein [Tanacetum cinerariifolium]
MWEIDSYKSHEVHMQLFEALEKSINRDQFDELAHDLAEARKKRKKRAPRASGSQVTPPPPPPPTSTNQDSPSTGSTAPSPTKTAATTEHQAWSTPDVTLKPLVSLTPEDLDLDEAMGPDEQAQLSNEEDIKSTHIPTTGDITSFIDWFCKRRGITELKLQDLEGPACEIVKVFHPDVIHLQYQMEECHKLLTDSMDDPILSHNVSKPLPLGGPPGQVIIQSDFFFNKDLEYLRYGSKGRQPALSISEMKAAYYPDAGLEQMVPDQFWIEEECKYDIAAMYGISHWWFQRQRFYIDRHTFEGDRSTVRTHMRILSVVRIEVFSMYGYDYMKKIVLHRADLNEHVIAERDCKYLYPNDDALQQDTQIQYGTLQQIVEALDYRVKEFRINRMNPEYHRVCDMRHASALDFALRESQTSAILAAIEVEIEHSLDEWRRHVTIVCQTKDLHTAYYTQLYDFLKYNQKEVDDLKAERLAKTQDPLALMATSNNPYTFPVLNQDQPSFNQNYMQQPMPNPKDITDPTTAMNMALALMAKAFKLNYSTPTNNNQRISSNPRNRQITQLEMNMGQARQMQMVGGNGGNQIRQYVGQNVGNLNGYNDVQNVGNQIIQNADQNPRIHNVGNQNGQIVVLGNANPNRNGNLVAARAEGNATGHNGNQIRCYNCRGVGHFARNCTVIPRRKDAAYLQTQLLIAQKKEA